MVSGTVDTAFGQTARRELELKCPPLPRTLLEAVEIANEPGGPDFERVSSIVQHDPGITARILKIVNSAYYGQRGRVESAQRAVLVLGPSTVLGAIMSMSLLELQEALDSATMPVFAKLVRHGVAVGFLAQHILKEDPAPRVVFHASPAQLGEAYTAGILHDFGKLVLLYNLKEVASTFYGNAASPLQILEAERAAFGTDHVETGLLFSRSLKLPDSLTHAIAAHHDCGQIATEPAAVRRLVYAVAAADSAANAFGYTTGQAVSMDARTEDPIWDGLRTVGGLHYASPEQVHETVFSVRENLEAYVESII